MRIAILSGMFLIILFTVRAEAAAPSENVLAEMGLAELHVLSDDQSLHIRGHGFKLKEFFKSGKLEKFHQHIDEFRERVGEFRERTPSGGFKKGDGFVKSKAEFRARVAHFKNKTH